MVDAPGGRAAAIPVETRAAGRRRRAGEGRLLVYVEDERGMRARLFIAHPLNKGIQTTITNDSMRIALSEMVASRTVKSKLNLGENRKIHDEFIRSIPCGDNSNPTKRLVMPMPPRN